MQQDELAQMMRMLSGGIVAQAVSVAAELGIADRLSTGAQTTAELAAATRTQSDKLFRLLRFLANLGVFQQDSAGSWNLTPLAELLRSDVPMSMYAGARMLGRMSPALPRLLENVRTGTCAYHLTFGKPIFEDLAARPDEAAIFDAAMNSFHGSETDAVLDACNYNGISTLAEIGGGSGTVMIATLRRYPALRGILFDQPHVLKRTARNLQAASLESRCRLVPGNFFESVPAGADTYSLRHIIHDWSDDRCARILSNVRRVIPDSGRLLVIEAVVPEGNGESPSKLFDMFMMLFPDGMERTEAQFNRLFAASGFELTGITPTESAVAIIEGRPV